MSVKIPSSDRLIQFTRDGAGHLLPEKKQVTRCGRRAVLKGTKAPEGTRRCVQCRDSLRPGAAPRITSDRPRSSPLHTSVLRAKLESRGLSLSRHRWRRNVGKGHTYIGKRPLERHRPGGRRRGGCKRRRAR